MKRLNLMLENLSCKEVTFFFPYIPLFDNFICGNRKFWYHETQNKRLTFKQFNLE